MLLDQLKTAYPEFWTWLQSHPNALRRVQRLVEQQGVIHDPGRAWRAFEQEVLGLTAYQRFLGGGAGDEPPPADNTPDKPKPDEPPGTTPPGGGDSVDNDVREELRQFLLDNELPLSLMAFIEDALSKNKPFSQIVAELRQTAEYKAAYPENDVRRANGFDWMPEAQIRAYRSEARRLSESYLGTTLTNADIATLLTHDISLQEWERKIQTFQDFERWGPTVRAVLEQELGYSISDDRAFAFMAPFIPTPELDRAYENALLRGRPAALGFGVRPEEEAAMLRQFGISPEKAFAGYQGIASEMPRAERLAAIEAQINSQGDQFPTDLGALDLFTTNQGGQLPFATLFRAIQFGDPQALAILQGNLSREVARFQAGGGPSRGGTGLLSRDERAAAG